MHSFLANKVMKKIELLDAVKNEVRKLEKMFKYSLLVFQKFFNENHNKNFETLKLVDFI